MVRRWNRLHLQVGEFFCMFFVLCLQGEICQSVNLEGLALREFRFRVDVDPFEVFKSWSPKDEDPCKWSGVHCIDGDVAMLDLSGMALEGTLSPELGKLHHLEALILFKNKFHGEIPKEIGDLPELQVLDLGYNRLSPTEKSNSLHRRLLQESSNLQAAAPKRAFNQRTVIVSSTGSGSFPALTSASGSNKEIPNEQLAYDNRQGMSSRPDPMSGMSDGSYENQSRESARSWASVLMIPGAALFFTLLAAMLVMLRSQENSAFSGTVQKAFVTGVPKLNRLEIEAACEDFTNVIHSSPDFTVFKGTLSTGVEIAAVSTSIASSRHWSKRSQVLFQKKISSLSLVNHKNFINLLGYCEEKNPFMRMLIFEYAANGSLHEHLHGEGFDHLDWEMRMRIIMGIAYCLEHMHDLSPPFVHPCLRSSTVFLTDDYASKIAVIGSWKEVTDRGSPSLDKGSLSDSLSSHPETNVYDFGLLLLEIISAQQPYDDQRSSIRNWAAEFIAEGRSGESILDPTLQSVENRQLDVICEVIQGCVEPAFNRRITMREVTGRLNEVTGISPVAATPTFSPLWWAELEILTEAS